MKSTLHFYRDKKRQFRWRLVAHNGNILAEGGEGYLRKTDMERVVPCVIWEPGATLKVALSWRHEIVLKDETTQKLPVLPKRRRSHKTRCGTGRRAKASKH